MMDCLTRYFCSIFHRFTFYLLGFCRGCWGIDHVTHDSLYVRLKHCQKFQYSPRIDTKAMTVIWSDGSKQYWLCKKGSKKIRKRSLLVERFLEGFEQSWKGWEWLGCLKTLWEFKLDNWGSKVSSKTLGGPLLIVLLISLEQTVQFLNNSLNQQNFASSMLRNNHSRIWANWPFINKCFNNWEGTASNT